MLPPVHLAVGYLCYAAYTRFHHDSVPADGAVIIAVVGAALPDLLDKSLAAVGVVPVGRTIGHSLLFAVPVMLAVWVLAGRRDESALGLAFAIGLGSHVVTDVPWHLVSGEYHELGFLCWPVTTMPDYTGTKPLGSIGGVEVTTLWIEAVVLVTGVVVWVRDGTPGLDRG